MKIRLRTTCAGPKGTFSPGDYDESSMRPELMKVLVDSGSAKRLDVVERDPGTPQRETASIVPRETQAKRRGKSKKV